VTVKKIENRLIFGEDMQNDKVGLFIETQCIIEHFVLGNFRLLALLNKL